MSKSTSLPRSKEAKQEAEKQYLKHRIAERSAELGEYSHVRRSFPDSPTVLHRRVDVRFEKVTRGEATWHDTTPEIRATMLEMYWLVGSDQAKVEDDVLPRKYIAEQANP
jgi:hypothetical protein